MDAAFLQYPGKSVSSYLNHFEPKAHPEFLNGRRHEQFSINERLHWPQ